MPTLPTQDDRNPASDSYHDEWGASDAGLDRRRLFLAVGAAAVSLLPGCRSVAAATAAAGSWSVPHDGDEHVRTWMAWPSSRAIWGRLLPGVQRDVAVIAATIARYEPVVMCATDAREAAVARRACGSEVEVVDHIPVDDCWMRDSGPIVRRNSAGNREAIGLRFNAWGRKQTHQKDRLVAERVAGDAELPFRRAQFVGEGGAIEADGEGTLFATESSLVNPNRNPGKTRRQVEAAVLAAYGATKMIWAPGIVGLDITDAHIDGTARFVRPGVALVQLSPPDKNDAWAANARQVRDILRQATDAKGRRLQVIEIQGPRSVRSSSADFLDSYVNFHLVNGAVITAQFGDAERDEACRRALESAFPGRTVEQLDVDRLHEGGGGIHCITMQEPL